MPLRHQLVTASRTTEIANGTTGTPSQLLIGRRSRLMYFKVHHQAAMLITPSKIAFQLDFSKPEPTPA